MINQTLKKYLEQTNTNLESSYAFYDVYEVNLNPTDSEGWPACFAPLCCIIPCGYTCCTGQPCCCGSL